jgi:hypothetical protein
MYYMQVAGIQPHPAARAMDHVIIRPGPSNNGQQDVRLLIVGCQDVKLLSLRVDNIC